MLNAESASESRIVLPPVPADQRSEPVAAWRQSVEIATYPPAAPDRYPAYLDSRVYQGSSGRVYPLPFHERIADRPVAVDWDAVHLENRWLRIMILPEAGGRLHVAYDKTSDYDLFYRNNVIKPALVGLAGPWISGGVEFNWPQHHRPTTYLPTDVEIERESDGSVTVWCSDHDPFARMKGMHGIRLRPDSSLIEARVRLYNRSELPQSFLWWANVAAAVHDDYQSFFPVDVQTVADHARRATTTYPYAGVYYGIDYAKAGPDHDRLDWYRNIPVPTSYMVLGTDDEFFGGYDHDTQTGFVHWASRDISPGKKQWTWGNSDFGRAWDRNLTDADGPYIELMAGVYTDNQPDFATLAPGETKTFSQYWYPIHRTGPVQQATLDGAASIRNGMIAVAVTRPCLLQVVVNGPDGSRLLEQEKHAEPGLPLVAELPADSPEASQLTLIATAGTREIVRISPRAPREEHRSVAVEPALPGEVTSVDELVNIGRYLAQYRHASRSPDLYFDEAILRDEGHIGARTARGARRYAAGQFHDAITDLRVAVERATAWTATPASGEAHYRLGLALSRLGYDDEAEPLLARSTWDAAWKPAALWALARISSRRGDRPSALARLDELLAANPEHNQAHCLRAFLHDTERVAEISELLLRDPLDQWARDIAGLPLTADAPTLLDVAIEYSESGHAADALRVLDLAEAALATTAPGQVNVGPLIAYHRSAITGDPVAPLDTVHCLPSRLEDISALAVAAGDDPVASALIGHWLFDRGRGEDAIQHWNRSLELGLSGDEKAVVLRNLGIAAYNVERAPEQARQYFESAVLERPDDSRLRYERDQLDARIGVSATARLARLEQRLDLVAERDDLSVVYAVLLVETGRGREALDLLSSRAFQPWEGGEGQVLDAWERASLAVAAEALREDPVSAVTLIERALTLPDHLGEARHPLAGEARLRLALGDALEVLGDRTLAEQEWRTAANSDGDFSGMRPQNYSEQTVHAIMALHRLGEKEQAEQLRDELKAHIAALAEQPARIDYFATSLPSMLLFTDPPERERNLEVERLRAAMSWLEREEG